MISKKGDTSRDEKRRDRLNMPNADLIATPSPVDAIPVPTHVRSVTDGAKQQRERKNALSRVRAQKQREQIESIRAKPEWERSEDESQLLLHYESKRGHKNDRSRERATETKQAVEAILQKPEDRRSAIEVQFLRAHLSRKNRKNEGDRMRRERLKALGLTPGSKAPHIRVTARGPLPRNITPGAFSHTSDPHPAYAYPYSPAVNGHSHQLVPSRPFSPFCAAEGTSFIIANGKASVDLPVGQP